MTESSPSDKGKDSKPSNDLQGEPPKKGTKRSFSSFLMHAENKGSIAPTVYKENGCESDRSMFIFSATMKSDLFDDNSEASEDSFPRIAWDDESRHLVKKRKMSHFHMVEPDEMPNNRRPRHRHRLRRSMSIYSRLHKLQESALLSSSLYQYCIERANSTCIWLDTITSVNNHNFAKAGDENGEEGTYFDCSLQVVA
jgi:hypothetical protein